MIHQLKSWGCWSNRKGKRFFTCTCGISVYARTQAEAKRKHDAELATRAKPNQFQN